jgi:hypothetical protein
LGYKTKYKPKKENSRSLVRLFLYTGCVQALLQKLLDSFGGLVLRIAQNKKAA